MSTVQDTLVTEFRLKDAFSAGFKSLAEGAKKGFELLTGLPGLIAGSGLLALGAEASKTAADMEALKMGLTSVAGGLDEANRQWERLKVVAQAPGLGFEEAVQGSVNLQAAGLSAKQAESALVAFGNALATVGRGKDDLDGVIIALTQIMSLGKVTEDNIRQIANRVPQLRKAMTDAFGTADTEALQAMQLSPDTFVQGIVSQLAKLPEVTSGMKNSFENLGDNIKQAFTAVGQVLNQALGPIIDKVGGFFKYLADSGVLARVTQGFMHMFDAKGAGDGLVHVLAILIASLQDLPKFAANAFQSLAIAFEGAKTHAVALAAILGAIFLGGSVLNGIRQIITAFRELAVAIREVGIVEVIMQAVVTGGRSLAEAAKGAAAGAIFAASLLLLLRQFMPDLSNFTSALGIDDVIRDANAIENGFNKDKVTGNGGIAGLLADIANTMSGQSSYAKQTADATQGMYRMQKDLRFEQRILGGGAIGAAFWNPVAVHQINKGTMPGGLSHGEATILQGFRMMVKEAAALSEIGALKHGFSPVTH